VLTCGMGEARPPSNARAALSERQKEQAYPIHQREKRFRSLRVIRAMLIAAQSWRKPGRFINPRALTPGRLLHDKGPRRHRRVSHALVRAVTEVDDNSLVALPVAVLYCPIRGQPAVAGHSGETDSGAD
jgi:hypothetical protein